MSADELVILDLYSGLGGVGHAIDAITEDYNLHIRHIGVDGEIQQCIEPLDRTL